QQPAVGPSPQREPLVARLVHLLLDGQTVEPGPEPRARVLPRLGPGDALRAALVAGQPLQLSELVDRAGGIQRHARSLISGAMSRRSLAFFAVACIALAGGLAAGLALAFGSSGGDLTRTEYLRRLGSICRRYGKQLDQVRPPADIATPG